MKTILPRSLGSFIIAEIRLLKTILPAVWSYLDETSVISGFEELVTLGAGQKVMSHTDSSKLLSPIEISSYGLLNSRLLQWAPGWLIETMESKPIAPNFHDFSLLSETYWANEELQEAFEVVAYGKDRAGLKFVSLVEGKK